MGYKRYFAFHHSANDYHVTIRPGLMTYALTLEDYHSDFPFSNKFFNAYGFTVFVDQYSDVSEDKLIIKSPSNDIGLSDGDGILSVNGVDSPSFKSAI